MNDLAGLQDRLSKHYAQLRDLRATENYSVYAIEHGLNAEECRSALGLLSRSFRANSSADSKHWLIWIAAAAEVGYRYDGAEYWDSFREAVPDWLDRNRDRDRIREFYRRFAQTHRGLTPSGPWARQFPIIALPITHAMLPRYLQRHLARALYDLRFRLANISSLEPADVGRLIAEEAYHPATRFAEFLQQEELVGRIVLALLGHAADTAETISPQTLQRIAGDLEQVRDARTWLREAARVMADRIQGTAPPSRSGTSQPASTSSQHSNVRPTISLRYLGNDKWQPLLEAPDMAAIAALNIDLGRVLRQSRCRIAGTTDEKPPGYFVGAKRRIVLKRWPVAREPLFAFAPNNDALQALVGGDCAMPDGPLWLFRIGADGIAFHIKGRVVHPGSKYVLISESAVQTPPNIGATLELLCDGCAASRFDLPKALDAETIAWLRRTGLTVAQTIRVWPAGLPAISWDGEGDATWLQGENPILGLQHDHPLEGYQIALNSGAPSFVKAAAQGIPVFVKLGELPKGKHRVRITAVRKNTADATLTGEINVLVREPAAWIPGSLGGDAFSVSLEPSSCNLEDLFENVATIVAYGPQSRKCTATIVLSLVNGDELLRAQVCEPLDFPISPQVWRKKFTQFASQGDWAWRYLDAASGKLVFTVDELGERTFPLQRKTLPLRWVVVRKDGITSVRLLDDTGADDNVATCISYALETPTLLTPHTRQDARIGIGIAGAGRLFYCTSGDDADRLIVSTGLTGNDLQALGFVPNVSDISAGRTTTVEALATIEAWHGARLAGPLADIRRQKILETVHSALFQQICGPAWNRAEAQFLTQSDARSRDELQSHVVKRGGFAVVLKRDYATLPTDGMEIAEWFGALADRFEICKDRSASEFALRLASAPNRIRTWYKNDLERLLENVTQYADVARGARFLALLCARDSEGHNSRMIPRWQWQ